MTKRSIIIAFLIALCCGALLALITVNFKGFFLALPIFTYFYNVLFIEIDLYYWFKKPKEKYNMFGALASICVLDIQLVIYYLLCNMEQLQITELIINVLYIIIDLALGIILLKQKSNVAEYNILEEYQ